MSRRKRAKLPEEDFLSGKKKKRKILEEFEVDEKYWDNEIENWDDLYDYDDDHYYDNSDNEFWNN